MASYYMNGYTPPEGVNSASKVKEYQRQLGVKADGIWGPNTQAAYERYANASSMSKFQEYYDTILGALSVPSISVSVPSKEDISGYLRPGVDLAISKRRAAGETAKAELDADAVSRGMGASTYVSSMKEREDDDTQSDISIMEAQYTATLAERIAAALEKYQSMSLQAQLQNAQYAYNAQTTAMNLASQWFNSYMNNAARAVKGSGGRSGKSGTASKNMSTLDYVRFVSGLSAPERSMLYNSGASEWVMMRTELEDALGKDGYRTVRSAFPILGSAGVKSISNKSYDKARDTWRWAR